MKYFFISIIEFLLTKHYFFDLKNHVISNDLKKEIDNLKYYDISNLYGAKKEWHNNLNGLIDKLKKNRIKDFLKIDVVRRTMYVSRANYTLQELKYLPTKKYLKENFVGSPIMFYKKPIYSSQRIHHQFLLYSFDFDFENFMSVNNNVNWQLKEIENSISNIQKQYFLFGKKK